VIMADMSARCCRSRRRRPLHGSAPLGPAIPDRRSTPNTTSFPPLVGPEQEVAALSTTAGRSAILEILHRRHSVGFDSNTREVVDIPWGASRATGPVPPTPRNRAGGTSSTRGGSGGDRSEEIALPATCAGKTFRGIFFPPRVEAGGRPANFLVPSTGREGTSMTRSTGLWDKWKSDREARRGRGARLRHPPET